MRLLPALALCAVLPLPVLAQTAEEEGDRGFLVGLIEDSLSSTARTVRVEGFEGALSSRATVASITIADREGVWLRATDLVLDWNRSTLLRGRIDVTELTAASIEILRPPLADPQAPTPEATPFSLPDLPVSVEIDALRSDRILLGAPFLGEDLALTLAGSVNLAGGEGAADIDARIIEGSAGQLSLAASYANETRVLAIDLDLQEEAEGLVVRALGLPGLPSVALTVEGTAPIDDYAARIALSTDGEPRIAGDVALKTTATEGAAVTARAFGLDVRGDVTPLLAPEAGAFFGPDVQLRAKGIRREDGSLVLTTLGIGAEALDLSGRAEITPQGWPARIDLQGTIGAEDGSPVPLPGAGGATVTGVTLDVAYDQDQGDAWTGLFAIENLARPGLSLPSLTLDGGGTLIPATATTPGQITALFDYAARGLSLDAEGATEALGADITGRLDLARGADGGPVELRALTLAAPGLDARIEGTIATAGGLLARTTTVLDAADLGRFATLTGADLGGSAALTIDSAVRPLDGIFDATATGTTQDLRLGIAALDPLLAGAGDLAVTAARDVTGLRIQRLDVATPALTITGTADVTSGASTARFDLSVTDLGLSFPGLSGPAQARATLDRAANGAATLAAAATLPGASLTVDATQAAQTLDAEGDPLPGLVTLDARAQADDLATYRPLLDAFAPGLTVTPSGGATLALTGTTQQDAATFDLTLDAQTTDLVLGIAPLDALLAGEGTLAGRVQRTGPQSFSVDGLRVATDLLEGTVTAALTEGVGQADLDLSLSDVAPVLGGLSGPGSLRGTAARAADGSLDLDLSATLPTGTARIDGTLAPPAEGTAFTGDVNADFSDIAPLGPLVGRTLGGAARVDLSGTARPDLSVLDLTFNAATRDLRLGLPQIEPLLAGPGTASGNVQRSPETGLDLTLDAATPQLRALASGTFTDASGNGRFDVTVTDAGTLAPGLSGPARATGTATQGSDGTIAVNAEATAPGASALIDASLAPDRDNEITGRVQASVTDLRPWSRLAGRPLVGGLDATVTGSLLPSLARFDLTVDATARNLDPGLPALAPVLAGTGTVAGRAIRGANGAIRVERLAIAFPNLSATAQGTTGGTGADLTFDARLADLALFVPQFPGPVTARGTARLGPDGTTTLDAQVGGPGGLSARVSGPLGGTATNLRATGSAPLELANAVLDPRRLEGPASFDLRLGGGFGLENLSGQVTVQGARLSDPGLAQSITGINGRLDIAGGTATANITGDLAAGGRLSIAGPVGLTPPLNADLTITGTGLVIRDPALYEARGDARLSVTGPLTGGALIAGTVALSTVELRVPASSVGALGEPLPVFHIEPSVPVRETLDRARLSVTGGDATTESESGGAGYGLDIQLDAPTRVFVRGRGLDAELGGQLRLTGTTAQVIPIGQFSLLRGRLDILGQRFTLSEGSATVQGDFNPFLRVVARTEARTGTDISIILEGPLASPIVTFQSSPELPQDEVLAQLLFGVDIASITPLQAVQLAAAAANLAGGGGGLTDSLRSGVGLADFDVTTTESGNVALRLGQYVSENIYTDVLVGTDETEATINLDLTPDLTVRAGVSSEGGTSVGLFFERDY